jgi:glycerate kinase
MNVLVCPDSFKGSLKSTEAASAIRNGLLAGFPRLCIAEKPLADGGEGTVEATVKACGGKLIEDEVTGPLWEKVRALMGILPDGTCVLELAQAAGLVLVPEKQRNPRHTTTYGVGELLKKALERGYRRIILGVGGSATCDGGMGALRALGARFFDEKGRELSGTGEDLPRIATISVDHLLRPPQGVELIIASDVQNPLYGPLGAAYVYAPQKGAGPEDVRFLDEGLQHFAAMVRQFLGVAVDDLPGGGAAGGIVAGLWAFLKARVTSGIRLIAELIGLEEAIASSQLVVSGEGKIDRQTFFGKTISGVLELCTKHEKPLLVLAGTIAWEELPPLPENIAGLFSIVSGPLSEQEAMERADFLLEKTSFSVGRMLARLSRLGPCPAS